MYAQPHDDESYQSLLSHSFNRIVPDERTQNQMPLGLALHLSMVPYLTKKHQRNGSQGENISRWAIDGVRVRHSEERKFKAQAEVNVTRKAMRDKRLQASEGTSEDDSHVSQWRSRSPVPILGKHIWKTNTETTLSTSIEHHNFASSIRAYDNKVTRKRPGLSR